MQTWNREQDILSILETINPDRVDLKHSLVWDQFQNLAISEAKNILFNIACSYGKKKPTYESRINITVLEGLWRRLQMEEEND